MVTNSLGHVTTYQDNENGLVVETWDARGGVTLAAYTDYNELLRETDPLGYTTTNTYDKRGNCLSITTPDEAQVQRAYDAQDPVCGPDRCRGRAVAVGLRRGRQPDQSGQSAR